MQGATLKTFSRQFSNPFELLGLTMGLPWEKQIITPPNRIRSTLQNFCLRNLQKVYTAMHILGEKQNFLNKITWLFSLL